MRRLEVQFVACHRMPSRSFSLRGRQFPVCARCTGVLLGYLSFPLFAIDAVTISVWSAFLLNAPALMDGMTQAAGWRESNNALRLATGMMSGIGQVALASIAGFAAADAVWALLRDGSRLPF